MEGAAGGAEAADPVPNANTPDPLLEAPKVLAPPNGKPPPAGVELAAAPNTGVELVCPNAGAAFGLAPKAGG